MDFLKSSVFLQGAKKISKSFLNVNIEAGKRCHFAIFEKVLAFVIEQLSLLAMT